MQYTQTEHFMLLMKRQISFLYIFRASADAAILFLFCRFVCLLFFFFFHSLVKPV